MTLDVAISIFRELEAHRYEDLGYEDGRDSPDPLFDVRLDAGTDRRENARSIRVRVKASAVVDQVDAATYQMVLDQAASHDLSVTVANDALELHR